MRTAQRVWIPDGGWNAPLNTGLNDQAQLVLVFGTRSCFATEGPLADLQRAFPRAAVVGCSTAGEICDVRILDNSLVATIVELDHATLRIADTILSDAAESHAAGCRLAKEILAPDLVHVLVLSDGLKVNGSELVKGLASVLPAGVAVTGGLSADGADFKETLVYLRGSAASGRVVAIGMYGRKLRVGYGSLGGWDQFGPERRVTKSCGNILYQLDGESALALYKRYLGEYAAGLPATGLRFPLSVRSSPDATPVVRTILAVNEETQSMTFAGDVPEGMYARLMRANFDRLVEGATGAAESGSVGLQGTNAELAILISCVGRKLILQQRTEEEVEAVRAVLGPRPALAGFYSYGEISPFTPNSKCELHNQTMTITLFSEEE
jgi:hypothetical protein